MQLVLILLLLTNGTTLTFAKNLDLFIRKGPSKFGWNNVLIVSNSISNSWFKTLKTLDTPWKLKNPKTINCFLERNIVILDASFNLTKSCIEMSSVSFNVLISGSKIMEDFEFKNQVSYYTFEKYFQQCIFSKHDHKIFCYDLGTIQDYLGISVKLMYRNLGSYGGVELSSIILEDIAKELNFSLIPIVRNDIEWGNAPENGQWQNFSAFSGLYGLLANGEFDLTANIFSFIPERSFTTDFLYPFYSSYSKLYLNIELVEGTSNWLFYLKPLNPNSWIMIGVTFAIFTYLRLLFIQYDSSQKLLSFLKWSLYTLTFAYYTGMQTMYLTTPKSIDLQNALDVLKLPNEWKLVTVESFDLPILTGVHPEFQEFLENGEYNRLESFEEALEIIVQTPGTVLSFNEFWYLSILGNTQVPSLISLGQEYPSHGGLLTKKVWPLNGAFNRKLLEFSERGMLDEFKRHIQQSKPQPFNQLKFQDIFTCFLIFGVAICSSVIVFFIELKF